MERMAVVSLAASTHFEKKELLQLHKVFRKEAAKTGNAYTITESAC